MTYLLVQIAGCLLLAALLGWFIGWSWRGFNDQDAIEDMRRTLRATDDIKDRELTAAYRRADTLQSEVDVAQRRLQGGKETRHEPAEPLSPVERPVAVTSSPESPTGDEPSAAIVGAELLRETEIALRDKSAAVLSLEGEIRALRKEIVSRADQIVSLESRVIELEPIEARLAERDRRLEQLRDERAAGAERRASDRAEAHRAVEQIESMRKEVAERDRRLNELRIRHNDTLAALQDADNAKAPIRGVSPPPTTGSPELEAELASLRQQLADKQQRAAQLERRVIELEPMEARLADCQRQVGELQQESSRADEVQRLLQRQIERNRKQAAVHRSVVDHLKAQANSNTLTQLEGQLQQHQASAAADQVRWRQRLADAEGERLALHERLAELVAAESNGADPEHPADLLTRPLVPAERPPDGEIERYRGRLDQAQPNSVRGDGDLQRIRGIGPKFASRLQELGIVSIAQIAAWDDTEIELIAGRLGTSPSRIRREDWVGAARQHGNVSGPRAT